jgi:hypothetical protein
MKDYFVLSLLIILVISLGLMRPVTASNLKAGIFVTPAQFTNLGTWSLDVLSQGYASVSLIGLSNRSTPAQPAETYVHIHEAGEYRVWVHSKDFAASPGTRFFEVELDGKRLPTTFGKHGHEGWKWEDGGIVYLEPGPVKLSLVDTSRFFARVDGVFITPQLDLMPPDDYEQMIALAQPDLGYPEPDLLEYPQWAEESSTATEQIVIENERVRVVFSTHQTSSGPVVRRHLFLCEGEQWVSVDDSAYGYLLMHATNSKAVGVREDGFTQTENFFPMWHNIWELAGTEKSVITQDIYKSGRPSWLIPAAMEVLDDQTIRLRAENELAVLLITWRLPQGSADPVVSCNLQAKTDGHFSLGIFCGDETALENVDFLFAPIRIIQRGFPDQAYLVTEQYSTAAASFMTVNREKSPTSEPISFGVVVDPSSIPYRWVKQEDSKFGLTIRGISGGVRPALFAPLFGMPDSQLAPGETYEITYRPVVWPGDWYACYRHIVQDIFQITAYRKNYASSLTEAAFNVQNLLLDDYYGGWDPVMKAHYNMEGRNVVSQADNLTYLQSYLLTEDVAIYEKRTLPSLIYLLTRGSFHFSSKPKTERTGNTIWMREAEEYPIGSPVQEFGTSVFGGAYLMTRGLVPRLRQIGMDSGVRSPSKGYPAFAENVWLYHFTGEPLYLNRAIQQADNYLARDVEQLKQTLIMDGFVTYKYLPYLPGLIDLYEASQDPKYLAAAEEIGRWLLTLVWTQPGIPEGELTIDAQRLQENALKKVNTVFFWRGDVQERLGFPERLAHLQDETVPAWLVSRVGLTVEDVRTFNSTLSGNILMTNWAPDLLRLAGHTGDALFEIAARNAVLGRGANYPGYYINDFLVHQLKADYPYTGPDVTQGIYYHHIPAYLAMLQDFLITQAWKWSNGQIAFPSVRQQGYVWFCNRHYGFAPGMFFDEGDMWLWLKEDLLKTDNIQIDWIAARKDGKVAIALMNEDHVDITTTITLGPDIIKDEKFSGTAVVYEGAGRREIVFQGNQLTLTVPSQQLVGIILDAPLVTAPNYARVPFDNLQEAPVGQTVAGPRTFTDFGHGIVLQVDPASYYAYVYTVRRPQQVSEVICHYRVGEGPWQVVRTSVYPYEFIVKVEEPEEPFTFYLEIVDHAGQPQQSREKVLRPLSLGD